MDIFMDKKKVSNVFIINYFVIEINLNFKNIKKSLLPT